MLPSYLLEGDFTKIAKRFYSICNDPFKDPTKPNTVKLLFTRHTFEVESDRRLGHCSQFLADFGLNKNLSFSIGLIGRILRLPADASNLLIIAQGTGVAPFLSILDRLSYSETNTKVSMVYGVRDNHENMLHKTLIEDFFSKRIDKHELVVACSRDLQADHSSPASNIKYERGYVQDCISKLDTTKFDISSTYVLICGNKNALGASVLRALPFEQSQVQEMRDSGKVLMELWNE